MTSIEAQSRLLMSRGIAVVGAYLSLAACFVAACSVSSEPETPAQVFPDTIPATIQIGISGATSLASGVPAQASVIVKSARGTVIPSPKVTWSVSDTAVAGVSASGVVTGRKVGSAVVAAHSGTATGSIAITVVPGSPAALVLTTGPASTWLGEVFTTQPVVRVHDGHGNAVTAAVVTVEISGDSTGLILGGDRTVTATNGVATFTNLSLSTKGTRTAPIALTFRSGALSVSSNPIQLQQLSATAAFSFTLTGPEETVLTDNQHNMRHTPDGPISFRRTGTDVAMWFSCGVSGCMLRGPNFGNLSPPIVNGSANPRVIGPSLASAAFDSNYAGGTAVLPAASGTALIMIYHAERHPCNGPFPFIRSMGLARSSDGGVTWTRQGQIARNSGAAPTTCDFGVAGPGDPTVVPSADGQYFYMYFNDRVSGRPDEIYMARAPITGNGAPGSWSRYVDGAFATPLLDGGPGTSVIKRSDAARIYAAGPAASFNVFLRRYVAVFVQMDGFYIRTSADGIVWSEASSLLLEPSSNADVQTGTKVIYYPSLLSLDQPNQTTTTRTGYLYYARMTKGGNPPHHMVRRPFAITPQ